MDNGNLEGRRLSSWAAWTSGGPSETIKRRQKEAFYKSYKRELVAVDSPDGGWAWFVNFASFLVSCIVTTTRVCFSILFPEFLKEFGAGAGSTSLVASIETALTCCCGPFVAVLGKNYGNRNVVVGGSILAFVGLLSSVFANRVIYLTISYGVLLGLANSATMIASLMMVGRYFRVKLPLAQGIGSAGMGLGTIIMPPFAHFLNTNYGWRGTLLIVSGLSLHTLVAACLLRPIYLKSDEELQQLHATRRASQQLKEVRRASQQLSELRRASQQLPEVRRASQQLDDNRRPSHSENQENILTTEELIALNKRRRSSLKVQLSEEIGRNSQQLNEMRRNSQDLKEVRRASQQLKEARRASQQLNEIRRASQQLGEVRRASQQLDDNRRPSHSENQEDILNTEVLIALNKRRRSSLKVTARGLCKINGLLPF